MPAPQFPLINGTLYSFAAVDIDIGGVPMLLKAINFREEWPQEGEYLNSPVAAGKTVGQYKASLDGELTREYWDYMISLLGDGFGAVPFNVGAQWRDIRNPERLSTFEAQGVTIAGDDASNSGGAAIVKITFATVIPFLQNGKSLVPPEFWATTGQSGGLGSLFVGAANLVAGFLSGG